MRFGKRYFIAVGILLIVVFVLFFAYQSHPKLPPLAQARELYFAALSYENDVKEAKRGRDFSEIPTLQKLVSEGYLKRPSLKEWQREFDVSFYTDSSQLGSGLPPGKRMFIKMVRRTDLLTIIVLQDGAMSYFQPGGEIIEVPKNLTPK